MNKKYIVTAIVTAAFLGIFQTASAAEQNEQKQFSVIEYNQALTEYEAGRYATAYNILLDTNAPTEAYEAFGWSK